MLQLKFPKLKPPPHTAPSRIYQTASMKSWDVQKPRTSSARLMMEYRRRLYAQASDPTTDAVKLAKIMPWISELNKRIEKRVSIKKELR